MIIFWKPVGCLKLQYGQFCFIVGLFPSEQKTKAYYPREVLGRNIQQYFTKAQGQKIFALVATIQIIFIRNKQNFYYM